MNPSRPAEYPAARQVFNLTPYTLMLRSLEQLRESSGGVFTRALKRALTL